MITSSIPLIQATSVPGGWSKPYARKLHRLDFAWIDNDSLALLRSTAHKPHAWWLVGLIGLCGLDFEIRGCFSGCLTDSTVRSTSRSGQYKCSGLDISTLSMAETGAASKHGKLKHGKNCFSSPRRVQQPCFEMFSIRSAINPGGEISFSTYLNF